MEQIEWTRVWRENATDVDTDRILFIGDSIVEGAKTLTVQKLKGKCNPTFITTSKDISDPYLFDEIRLVSKQDGDCYKLIYLNNGLHTGGLSKQVYKSNYISLIKKIQTILPDAVICLGLSTPVTKSENADAGKWSVPVDNKSLDYSDVNEKVLEFNEAVGEIANEMSLASCDLYSVVDGINDIRTSDGYHYKPEGNEIISDTLSEFIKSNF